MANVIGLDPSLTGTGWAVGDDTGTVHGEGDDRLVKIFDTVLLLSEVVDLAVIEDLPTHAMGAGKTGMAQGVVRLALMRNLVPYILIAPASLKKFATGKGSGISKSDMRMALYQRSGVDLRDDNQADAAWLRHLGYALLGQPKLQLPKTHLSALDKVAPPCLKSEGLPA